MLMEADKARTVLEGMEVSGWQGIYVLGCIDRRVTVYSQQVRALNLAAALMAAGRVKADEPIVIVGAGAAGLTCAAGLRRLGARVTVLEARDEILPLFREGSSRWLHPGVYDWPLEGWSRDRAGLPLLNWEHGPIDDVRIEMEAAWNQFAKQHGVVVHTNVSRVWLGRPGDVRRTVTWSPGGSQRDTTVILAVGFGSEPTPLVTERRYWEADDFDVIRSETKPRKWLISGCGDGALTDLFRLCLKNFRHDTMLRDFTRDPRMRDIRERIRQIERDAALQDDPAQLHDAYAELDAPWVVQAMRNRPRRDTIVILNSPTAEFLTRDASALNRFLAGQLYRARKFELMPGWVEDAQPDGDEVMVRFDDKRHERFHRIVRRHGPKSALSEPFPLIAEAIEQDRILRRNKPTLTDQTRARLWIEGIFGSEQRDVPDPEAQAPKFKAVIVSADDVSPWRDQIEIDLTRSGGAVELLRTGTYAERLEKIRAADVLVLLIGHRLGPVPVAHDGGNGHDPWLRLALQASTGIVVTGCVDDQAPWSEKKEQDELLTPGADPVGVARRVRALAALKTMLPGPLVFGTQATLATPADLATAVATTVMKQLSSGISRAPTPLVPRRSWIPRFDPPLQPAPHFQGRAALLARLEQWWSDPASPDRVMALVAIGGAGKTALAERMLRHIAARPSGGGVFVWSFYDMPSSGDFLREACRYFAGDPGQDVGGRLWALTTALRGGESHLLVLDGLERVQSDSTTGRVRGTLEDAPLRQLMQALAAGLGRARGLVTSRFPLADLESWKGAGLTEVRLDDLDPSSARTLLRAWGVRGNDATLDTLAERVGGHALSVSVLGSYITNFHDGDPAAADRLDLSELGGLDPKTNKLMRLLTAYATALPDAERQVMARLALFPRGIEVDVLADLVRQGTVAGVLRGWDQARLAGALAALVSRGLAFAYRIGNAQVFTAHPFVRDSFVGLLDVQAVEVHRAMAEQLANRLDERPGTQPTDSDLLDRYEAMIVHLLGAGQLKRAFDLYDGGLGGYGHLGKRLGDYARAARILAHFPHLDTETDQAHQLSLDDQISLLMEQGLVYANIDLAGADHAYSIAEKLIRTSDSSTERTLKPYDLVSLIHQLINTLHRINASSSDAASPTQDKLAVPAEPISIVHPSDAPRRIDILNQSWLALDRCALALLQGRLNKALFAAKDAVVFAQRGDRIGDLRNSIQSLAYTLALMGALDLARICFDKASPLPKQVISIRELYVADLQARLGDTHGARSQAEASLAAFSELGNQRNSVRCHTLLARLSLPGDSVGARRHLAPAREWATRTGDLEVILQVHQLAAAIHRTTDDLDAALAELNEGIRIADDHGAGLYSIDLRLDRGRLHLDRNDPGAAQRATSEALERSTHAECGYIWGEADANHLLGEAHLARHDRTNAERSFECALELRTRIEHPAVTATRDRLAMLRA
ncbi:MAG TPA: FAD-dependent oxidoreductase [Kofleriaceae bacterium]